MSPLANPALPETAADLRALYRAAEARAGRLRVLAEAGQALAAARPDTLDAVAADVARKAANLAGYAKGHVALPDAQGPADSLALELRAPGSDGAVIARLLLEDRRSEPGPEERETLDLLCQLLGASLSARAREQRLGLLLGELLRSSEVERRRIAHELHDGVAQSAAALMRRLELASDGHPEDLASARDQAHALVGELRRVIVGMRPPVLDDLGLVPALRQLAADAESEGLAIALDVAMIEGKRPKAALETALFRVAQEGLNNVHAHAGQGVHVAVSLEHQGEMVVMQVRDDGCGFDPAIIRQPNATGGLGLAYMRERIELLGGSLAITSAPGQGCTLRAELPAT